MTEAYFRDEDFSAENLRNADLPAGEYEHCSFRGINLSGANLSKMTFSECIFEACDLSNSVAKGTCIRDTEFIDCKLMGINFNELDPFLLSFSFKNCLLSYSSFSRLKLKNTTFDTCKLVQVDFSEADFTSAYFGNCDFSGAIFYNTKLEKADFSTSRNFSIDPENNTVKGARFSSENIGGLLEKHKIKIV
jgi:uncharacterized protein YjbI with pentapeptide repeats